jgi:hypothetical protein
MVNELNQLMIENGLLEGAIAGSLIVIILTFLVAFYVYHSFAWMVIAKKQKHKYPWLAWIPFANSAMRLQLGKFPWALAFLFLIPILGWIAIYVLLIISHWRIFEKMKYPGYLSLIQLADFIIFSGAGTIGYLVVIGLVAWVKK